MPYVKYTYRCPGGPNITSVRAVRPRYEWLAGSSCRYASTSTNRAERRVPFGRIRTKIRPSRSRATAGDGRAKKDRGSLGDGDRGLTRGSAPAVLDEELAQAAQGPRVDHVFLAQPPPLRRPDTESHEPEVDGGVRVRVHGELRALAAGPQDVLVVQVETVGERVHLQSRTGPRRRLEHLFHVVVERGAMSDHPGRGVPDHVDVRVLHGKDDATRHL